MIVQGNFQQYEVFIFPALLLVFDASLFSLVALLVRHKTIATGTAIFAGILPFIFNIPSLGIAWGVILAVLLLILLAMSAIQKEVAGSLRSRIPRFVKQGLGLYFTAAALVISLFYLNRIDDRQAFSILFPQSLFDFTSRTFSGTIHGAAGSPLIQPEQFANAMTVKIKDIIGEYHRYLPLVAAVAFFFAMKAASIIFRLVSIALAVLLMKLLILVRVVKKEKEQIEAERLVL